MGLDSDRQASRHIRQSHVATVIVFWVVSLKGLEVE